MGADSKKRDESQSVGRCKVLITPATVRVCRFCACMAKSRKKSKEKSQSEYVGGSERVDGRSEGYKKIRRYSRSSQ